MRRRQVGVGLLRAAAVIGLVHAAFTVYWAAGGRWLLRTVGAWAVQLAESSPVACAAVLSVVALLKVSGSLIPLAAETRPLPGRRLWRRLAAAGSVILIGYGLMNVVVAWLVLGGLITTPGGYDRAAELGHAALWDPLFLLWGLLLAGGVALTGDRAARRSGAIPTHAGSAAAYTAAGDVSRAAQNG